MSRYRYEMGGIIRDTEIDFPYPTDEIIELLDEKDQKIADLEAKLAESENDYLLLEEQLENANEWSKYFQEENEQLKQQLAETEEERDGNYENYSICWKDNTHLKQQLADKDNEKIKFAIAELEKVKEFFLEEHRDEEMDTDYIITKDAGQIADYLLDQIKLLKEGK